MSDIHHFTTILRLLSDQARLRVLAVLDGNELTVKEMTEILNLGQSTLSSQLSQLKDQGLVSARKEGQFVFYRLSRTRGDSLEGKLLKTAKQLFPQAPWYEGDQRTLQGVMDRRQEASLSYFRDQKTQNQRSPGQGWESLATAFLLTLHDRDIADLGCGNGRLAALLARHGNRVIGIDNSPEQIRLAQQLHTGQPLRGSLEFRQASMENTGFPDSSFDLVVISHALHHIPRPLDAILEAGRILQPGGQLLILDLANHHEDWIKDRFGDFWLGFHEDTLTEWLHQGDFSDLRFEIAGRDMEYPSLEALVVTAWKKSTAGVP